MSQDDLAPIGSGRDTDVGGDVAGGMNTDIGPSKQHGDAQDLGPVGDGQTVRTGRHPISKEDAENADVPRSGTPEDLKLGKRRTVGMDEDAGAGMRDISGVPDSTTGAG